MSSFFLFFANTDFNDDEAIDAGDMNSLLDILTNNDLTQDLKDEIIVRVSVTLMEYYDVDPVCMDVLQAVESADQDDDACIDFEEFQRQIYFYPDFYEYVCVYVFQITTFFCFFYNRTFCFNL